MIEGKGLGDKKINRVGISLSNSYEKKLHQLATACQLKPTTLAGMLVERCLDDPLLIEQLQNELNVHSAYRVIPYIDYRSNDVIYLMDEKDD